jgi:predicted dehydrogenase
MRAFLRRKWVDSTLDYHREPGDYRIRVRACANVDPLTDLYFVRPRSARLIWNYLSQVGPVGVWRKVASRLQERFRNEKYISFGYGEVLEAPEGGRHALGDLVAFVAPGMPACVERLVLADHLVTAAADVEPPPSWGEDLLYLPFTGELAPSGEWWQQVRSWDRYAGNVVAESERAAIAAGLARLSSKIDWQPASHYAIAPSTHIKEVEQNGIERSQQSSRQRAVLFGYGHYAKTNILPNVSHAISVEAIHEVDPAQIPKDRAGIHRWDTSPLPRADEEYDVYLIAGYHHTHAPLASEALRRGAYAVVEKPVAVDHEQLDVLLEDVERSSRGYFGCFHKRYSPLNDTALHDLRQPPGAPIDYHCIVYEVPLPELHWYRWPNSKSRLVSNGCHWLDHFLYVNGFCEVRSLDLDLSPSEVINCTVTLENGAYFTMVLTDRGSERIGLQDYVEMRAGEVTVKITNNAGYLAEDRDRVLRRVRINKMLPYKRMYNQISERIARGEGGDTLQSIRVSTRLVLDLEDELNRLLAKREESGGMQARGLSGAA